MKTIRICLLFIMILAVSCAKSRFATTTRSYHDGKVVYTNHYPNERSKLIRPNIKHPAPVNRDESVQRTGNPLNHPEPITTMNLIASTDNNFVITAPTENLVHPNASAVNPETDTKNGVTAPNQGRATFTKDPATGSWHGTARDDRDTVKELNTKKEKAKDTSKTNQPKTEKLGLVGFLLSFLGIVPLFGIPFAVLGIVFGAISLKKIKRNPKKYKGKELAVASIVIGSIMMVINIIVIATSIHSASQSTQQMQTNASSSSSCRV